MKKKSMSINSILKQLNETNRILRESYIFDGEGDSDADAAIGYTDEGEEGDIPSMEDEGMPQEEEMASSSVDDEIIQKIRDAALEGIEKYKDNVMEPHYNLYKGIFIDIDKFITDRLKGAEQSSKA